MDFIAFSWNSVNVYWYGIVMAVAVILGLAISWINVWLHKENFDIIIKIMVWGIPCSIVGARIVYVMQNMDYFSKNLSEIFCLWQGGLSIYGALLVFFAVCAICLKVNQMQILYWLDLIMPAIVFGLVILQITNFMMQFSVGTPLSVDIPNDHTLQSILNINIDHLVLKDIYIFNQLLFIRQRLILVFLFDSAFNIDKSIF